jgi:hypothetical protein
VYAYLTLVSLALFIGLFAARRVPLLPGGLDYVGRYLMQASAAGTWLIGAWCRVQV